MNYTKLPLTLISQFGLHKFQSFNFIPQSFLICTRSGLFSGREGMGKGKGIEMRLGKEFTLIKNKIFFPV
jgi:hypothetical protein